MRRAILLILAISFMWGFVQVYNKVTDGFSLRAIASTLPERNAISTLSSLEKTEISAIMDAPFYYLGKGCQFYAFESEDGKYVLKFFKHKHFRPLTWLYDFPVPSFLKRKVDDLVAKRNLRIENLFSSCEIAFEDLREPCGLLFLHLNREKTLGKEITIVDRIGLKRRIAIDDYEFVLQKKAITVEALFRKSSPDEIRSAVCDLANLVISRCKKGVCDRDRSFVQNVAFSIGDHRAVSIDIGQFYKDEAIKDPQATRTEVIRRLSMLIDWTKRKYPEILPLVQDEVERYTKCL